MSHKSKIEFGRVRPGVSTGRGVVTPVGAMPTSVAPERPGHRASAQFPLEQSADELLLETRIAAWRAQFHAEGTPQRQRIQLALWIDAAWRALTLYQGQRLRALARQMERNV